MGRSKFPGKPSKHTNRKRVNVLPPTGETTNVDTCNAVTVESVAENKQDEDISENDSESTVNDNVLKTKVSIKRRLTRKMQSSLRNKNASKRSLLTKICGKTTIKTKLTTKTTRNTKLSRRSVRFSTATTPTRTNSQKEANNLVGKFVLPTRSVHSSRVIKPNKRFINVDLNESLTVKKKVITKKHCVKQDEDKSKPSSDEQCGENSGSCSTSTSEPVVEKPGRVVLRQARLKLHTQAPSGPEGPFSSNLNNGSPPGTVTCGVCGAVRFYRFVKQARKFNIYSCESCRKFISKMIKRQSCGKGVNSLVCLKGQGMCHVPPIVRSQQWKLIRCAYKARCPACWLKMCLRSFQMPLSLKHNLLQMLPENMKGPDIVFNNSSLWQSNIENIDTKVDNKVIETTITQRPLRFRNPTSNKVEPPPVAPAPVVPAPNSDIKRQKIDLKGPRVKHVCRSASIVLGQPLATFGAEEKKSDPTEQPIETEDKDKPVIVEKSVPEKSGNKSDSNSSETDSSEGDKIKIQMMMSAASVSSVRRERNQKAQASEARPSDRKQTHYDSQNGISIDFWEGYDPDEICQSGYCLISSEPFTMPSICFLCGSGGRDYLIYCSMCCESYHSFCLEQRSHSNIRQNLWVCPKCTVCPECNQSDRQKINCQKCMKAYHPECFNNKWNNSLDQPTVCSKCLRCKSCGSENITKFVGNLPLCITCFKLRKEGNFCPICQHCYDENECCAKMMECSKCNKWVHSQCEKLSEEHYQILAILPESVEYICALCTKEQTWRKAIDAEIKSSFHHLIRLLSKNKTARTTLKWSPLNNHSPCHKSITNVRKLQFSEAAMDVDNNNCSKSVADINKIYSFEENELQMKAESESLASTLHGLSMVDIKNKLNSNEYCSVREFNKDMEEALENTHSEQLKKIYRSIFHSIFPWYEINGCQEEPSKNEAATKEESQSNAVKEEDRVQVEYETIDTRMCSFCKITGDGYNYEESRLLYCGQNEWVHANCALWSSEVYEEIDGSLQNVQSALSRGRMIRCSSCKQKGASVGCCFKGCYETYHFKCAQNSKCQFMHDKTVYCSTHEVPKKSHPLTSPKEFDIYRSVFVEVDKKKRKYCDMERVNFMVGSLCVKNLGKVNPLVSDYPDVIIPMGFVCTRLFWSTVDPWKLVPYIITTSVLSTHCSSTIVDKNFTVDHSLSKPEVEKILKELYVWQKDIDKKKSEVLDYEDDEEPQNGADLLSPELTNAILEEIPHDLLDGISVQDIFPASLAFSMDNKLELGDDDNLDMDMKSSKELRRSKSEVMPQINKLEQFSKSRGQQRSCSLTLSCKLDSSLPPAIKKRKMAAATRENNMFFQLLQVDGNCDDSSSSECGSPTGTGVDPWGNPVGEEPVTCEKCQCTYRTQASYKRHLDTCEVLCTSESDSELDNNMIVLSKPVVERLDEPSSVVLTSYESYQNEIHTSVLNTQTFVTAKSTELISMPHTDIPLQMSQPIQQKQMIQNMTVPVNTVAPMNLNQQVTDASHNSYTINHPALTIGDNHMSSQPAQYCVNQTVPLCVNQPLQLQSNSIQVSPNTSILNAGNQLLNQTISINQGSIQINQPSTLQQPLDFQPQSVTIQSVPFSNNVTPILNVTPQNQFALNGKIITTNPLMQTVNVPTTQWVKPVAKPTVIAQKTIKARARSRTIAAKRHYEDGDTIILNQNSTTSPVIVQHLPSTNFVPFVDAFQQQTGQNVQYVATIAPQVNATLPTQPLVQLQPDNNLISIVPGLQPTMIIQQPRVIENQLVLDSNGSLGWAPQTVQPVYYGFETIVQNTVMQSQQFLPTTVPGVLTANSSYSTTTQVFQTSKLEPVLDVSSNSFVLVNPGQLVNSQAIEVPQYSQSQPINTVVSNILPQQEIKTQPQSVINYSQSVTSHKPATVTTSATHSITLPTAPFVPEQGIPTNIVVPTPKPPTSTQSRPMSRVLPMPTKKEHKKFVVEEAKKQIIEEPKKIISHIKYEDVKKVQNSKFEEVKKYMYFKYEEVNKIQPPPIVQIKMEEHKPISPPMKEIKVLEMPKLIDDIDNPVIEETKEVPVEDLKIEPVIPAPPPPPPSPVIPPPLPPPPNVEPPPPPPPQPEEPKAKPSKIIIQDIKILEPKPVKATEVTKEDKKPKAPPELVKEVKQEEETEEHKSEKSLKLVFHKQGQDGTYKVSNSIHVAPFKLKNVLPLVEKNKQDEKIEKLEPVTKSNGSKKENDNPMIVYTMETKDGFKYSSTSISDLWDKVIEAVQAARAAHNMAPLPTSNVSMNVPISGLKNAAMKYLIEQLPGATKCSKYKPTFSFPPHSKELEDEFLTGHSFGSIRCAPLERERKEYDMFGWLSSKHRSPDVSSETEVLPRRGSVTNLPMAMRFRQLKLTSKQTVGVFRSSIHGKGLFCLKDIESGEMVIEYAGEVIRSILTDKREKYYNSKGIGCYMFRVDDNFVVDATMKGNAARFINHSCDPNCYSKVVEILGHKHIIIFALRRILSGEELTYDYKFPFEEDKIPCTCGSRKCRKFLN